MNADELLAVLQGCADEVLGAGVQVLTPDLVLGPDGEIDSLDLMEIVMVVEEKLDIVVESEDLKGLDSIAKVLVLLAAKVEAKQA
jgi:acyl carrier protein